jgi:hypothetical protein
MDFQFARPTGCLLLILVGCGTGFNPAAAKPPVIQFDMPAAVAAADTGCPGPTDEITVDLVLSTLIVNSGEDEIHAEPPVEHLIVRCALRDRFPIVDFAPKTELQSDFASPISISKKDERTDSFGVSFNGNAPPYGTGRMGADDSKKQSDATEFQRHAPMQAVIASGTTDRGRGVYFKFRWTAIQVLEGEKHFQVSFAVPRGWRGGLIDVDVTAAVPEKPLFGAAKLKTVANRQFVVAAYRRSDTAAGELALRLAELDRKLAEFATRRDASPAHSIADFLRRLLADETAEQTLPADWYRRIIGEQADPYVDEQIRSLPMPVRVAVLDYVEAVEELTRIADAGDRFRYASP